jgi:hypothetical protein
MMMILLGITAALFLLDCFITIYCRSKVQFVALNTAQFLADLPIGANVQDETERHASSLLQQFGMSLKDLPKCEKQNTYTVVTICANPPSLLGASGLFLPVIGQLTDTEISTPQTNRAVGWMSLEWNNTVYGPPDIPNPGRFDRPIYLPILSEAQIDSSKKPYMMLDTAFWPKTHVIYHTAYDNFPDNPGPTGGTFIETNGGTVTANHLLTSQLGGGVPALVESLLAQYPPPPPLQMPTGIFPFPNNIAQQKIQECLNAPVPPIPCGFVWEPHRFYYLPDPAQARNLVRHPDRLREALLQ